MTDIFQPPKLWKDDRYILRPYVLDDAPAMLEAVLESYDHLKPFMPWASSDQTLEQTERIIDRMIREFDSQRDFVFGIWRVSDGRYLGGTGFHLREGPIGEQSAEVGMWIRGSEAGKGVGRDVAKSLVNWSFTEWPWLRLSWYCDQNNIGSIKCAEAAGFVHEGVLREQYDAVTKGRRNTVVLSRLKSEWEAE